MNFGLDSSVQTNTVFSTTGTSFSYVNSNDLSTKQDLLISNTNLLGIGTSITAIDYNNITINKPTNFQCDYNSTLINIPTNFQSDYNTTVINKPDLSIYALNNALNASNITSGTLTVSRGGIGTTTLTNNQILLGNGTSNIKSTSAFIYDVTNNRLGVSTATPSDTLHVTGKIRVADGGLVSSINFDGDTSYYEFIKFTSSRAGFRPVYIGCDVSGNKFGFFTTGGGLPDPDSHLILDRTGGSINSYFNGNLGIGKSNPSSTLDVSGNITGVNLIGSGSGITNLNYSNITNPPNLNIYALDASLNALSNTVSTKQNIFTCVSPLIKNDISNNISIDLSAYPLKINVDASFNNVYTKSYIDTSFNNVYTKANTDTLLNTKQNIITVSTPLIKDVSNNLSIDLSAYPLKSYVDGSLNTINTTLSTKQNNLTFNNPLLNTSNTITFKYNSAQFNIDASGNLSLVSSLSFLPLSGGTLTGNLIINSTPPNIQMGNTNGHNLGIATGAGMFSSSALSGDMILRSINNLLLQSGTGASALTINSSNNVSITNQLILSNNTTGNNPLYISSTVTNANNCIQFKNNSTYYAYIGLGGTTLGGNYQNNLFLESAFGSIIFNTNGRTSASTPNMIIDTNGNVSCSGSITTGGNISCNGSITTGNFNNFLGGLRINGSDTGNTIYQGTGNIGITANNGYSINFSIWAGNSTIMSINNTSVTTYQPLTTTDLYVGGSLISKPLNIASVTTINSSTGIFISTNRWWQNYGNFGYLNVAINVLVNTGGSFFWMGRIAVNSTGILGFYSDYSTLSSGSISISNFWDSSGGNYIYLSSTNLTIFGGSANYKIIG